VLTLLVFLATIALTVMLQSMLRLPPAVGMMLGLGLLKLYSYAFNRRSQGRQLTIDELDDVFTRCALVASEHETPETAAGPTGGRWLERAKPLNVFRLLERVEWDTLLFFFGVILGVGGLGAFGYLATASRILYDGLGPTVANVLVGLLSALIDNVPVMVAVLTMNPTMSQGQWLLVTLTAVSRLYLGRHFIADVVSAGALGLAVLGCLRRSATRPQWAFQSPLWLPVLALVPLALLILVPHVDPASAGGLTGLYTARVLLQRGPLPPDRAGPWRRIGRVLVALVIYAAVAMTIGASLRTVALEADPERAEYLATGVTVFAVFWGGVRMSQRLGLYLAPPARR